MKNNETYLTLYKNGTWDSNRGREINRLLSYIDKHSVKVFVIDNHTLKIKDTKGNLLLNLYGTQYLNHPNFRGFGHILESKTISNGMQVSQKKKVASKPKRRGFTPVKVIGTCGIVFALSFTSTVVAKMNTMSKNNINEVPTQEDITSSQDEVLTTEYVVSEDINESVENTGYEISDLSIDINSADLDKYQYTLENYGSKIGYYAEKYGLDPYLVLAIATQESGKHVTNTGTAAAGLMQIEKGAWLGESITSYAKNATTGEFEQKTISNITNQDLNDLDKNIEIGCMYLQKCFRDCNYNLVAAIQAYNYGISGVQNMVSNYAQARGVSYDVVIKDYADTGWLDLRSDDYGDSSYVEHVLRYAANDGSIDLKMTNIKTGEIITYHIASRNLSR